ncbi:hypothetical protein POPTR_009G004650v4 [Populus trichocarpa]|uniref:Uncharacterized protein n=1 Tax=Populus trichocarpa TaxID=3694 RepID=A0ACC0SFP8_POPTR|nr:hypothetical protein POPTR_009G004650v4 [Populus trichocarpa]
MTTLGATVAGAAWQPWTIPASIEATFKNSSCQPLHQQPSCPQSELKTTTPLSSSNRAWSLPCNDNNRVFIIPAEHQLLPATTAVSRPVEREGTRRQNQKEKKERKERNNREDEEKQKQRGKQQQSATLHHHRLCLCLRNNAITTNNDASSSRTPR